MHDVYSKSSSSEKHACMILKNKQKPLKHIEPGVMAQSNYLILSPHFAGREIYKLWNNKSTVVWMIIFESFGSSNEWSKESSVKSTEEKISSAGKLLITLLISQANLQITLKLLVILHYY